MLRMIIKQLWNRRRNNAWLAVELALVFSLVWYLMDYLFVLGYNYSIPSYRDLDHTWQVTVRQLPDNHPGYQVSESDSAQIEQNFFRILDRIKSAEGVEAVAVMDQYSAPGDGSFIGYEFRNSGDTTRVSSAQVIYFDPRWDFFNVFRYTYADGREVKMADVDMLSPHTVVVGDLLAEKLFPGEKAVGREIEKIEMGQSETLRIAGVIGDIKRFDYLRIQEAVYTALRVNGSNCEDMVIAIRSSDRIPDVLFQEKFKEQMSRELQVGNFYLKSVKSYPKLNATTDREFGQTSMVRSYTAVTLFFLLNIMLCVMGTFWYRVNQRKGEIGLRMAMGSTRRNIRKILFLEGLALLTVMAVVSSIVNFQFAYADLLDTLGQWKDTMGYLPDQMIPRFLITTLLTWVVLALVIVLATWLPVSRAAKLAPAEALRDE